MSTDALDTVALDALRQVLRRQYTAALAMLRAAIERCPDALWADASPAIPFVGIACRAAFFTRYYLHPSPDAFRPWPGASPTSAPGTEAGTVSGEPLAQEATMTSTTSRAEVLAYVDDVLASLDDALAELDLTASTSGFPWYRMSKLEHQLVNLRQLQHYTAQLVDRLRTTTGTTVAWIESDRTDVLN